MDAITNELFDLIKIYNVPCKDEDRVNPEAKKALMKFREILKQVQPKTCYNDKNSDFFYLHFLTTLRAALINNQYVFACNELGSLIYRYPISEERMKMIVLKTLERYL